MNCLFCKLKNNTENYLYENDSWYGIADKYPASPGHSLVILKTHKVSFFELTDHEAADAKDALEHVKKTLDAKHHPDAYNIAVNEGEAAGRTIHHVHFHLIPRYAGKGPKGGIEAIFKGQ
ncbi:HIT family protein [Candidatus Micrarchaeota archaeon]|nr:HIT family protein [Candidatus Micrarchaeota archaeon]